MSRLRKSDRGANLLEFAVIAPLLFLLLFGVIEFARLIHDFNTVRTAAREGARYATTVGDTDGDTTPNYLDCQAITAVAVAKVAGTNLDSADITVRYLNETGTEVADCVSSPPFPESASGADIDSGYNIEVTASATFDGIVPLLSSFLDGIDLSSTQTRTIFKGVVGEG